MKDFDHRRPESLVVVRLPGGAHRRASVDIGDLVGLDVDRDGDTTVIGQRRGAVVALTWRRHRARPTLVTVLAADQLPRPYGVTLQSNAQHDLAVFVRPYPGDNPTVGIVRMPHDSAWDTPLLVAPSEYGATLDTIALESDGAIVGAFRHDYVLERRALPAAADTFDEPHVLIAWPEIAEVGDPRPFATIEVGANGDLVASLGYSEFFSGDRTLDRRGAELYSFRIVIEPREGAEWRHETLRTADFPRFVVDAAGDVSMFRIINMERWTPETRTLTTYESTLFKGQNPRGDLLVGTMPYRGKLSLWPSGGKKGPALSSPPGDFMSAFLGLDRMAYVTTLDRSGDGTGSHLWRHQF
jgi:hypothetical protein